MRFRAILGRSFEAVKQVSGTVIHFLVVGPFYATLTSANLRGADLASAHLIGADLTGANLRGANLAGADLTNVDYGPDRTDDPGPLPRGFPDLKK